jgi:hypothetical protein
MLEWEFVIIFLYKCMFEEFFNQYSEYTMAGKPSSGIEKYNE